MGLWPTALDVQKYETFGQVAGSTDGTTITASATVNTKGAWTQLVASTGIEAVGILVMAAVGTDGTFLLDIGIGTANNERVIIPDLLVSGVALESDARLHLFPIRVKAGSRISARCQSSAVSGVLKVLCSIYAGGFNHVSPLSRVTAYGISTADSGALQIDPGATANTKGAWSELVASSSNPIRALLMTIGAQTNFVRADAGQLLDLGIGASLAEKIIIPDLFFQQGAGHDGFSMSVFGPFYYDIPSGKRITARAQSSITNAADRVFDLALYGID